MSKMDVVMEQEDDDLVENAQAICSCLTYLKRETERLDLTDAARLIGMAYNSISHALPVSSRVKHGADPTLEAAKTGGLPN